MKKRLKKIIDNILELISMIVILALCLGVGGLVFWLSNIRFVY